MTADATPGAAGSIPTEKRPSARLIVLDLQDRVLLFRFAHVKGPLAGTVFWATPGGALGEGEDWKAAARRELVEETGFDLAPGPQVAVWHARFRMPDDGRTVDAEERHFAVRANGATDESCNPDAAERDAIAEARWWSVAEIAAVTETIYPENIAEMAVNARTLV